MSSSPGSPPPARRRSPGGSRLSLLPGVRVLEDGPTGYLVLGAGPAAGPPITLPGTANVRRVIGALLRGEQPPADPPARTVLDRLAPVLIDGCALIGPGIRAGDAAAEAARDPAGFSATLAARNGRRVAVQGGLGADPGPALRAAGLVPVPAEDGVSADAVLVLAEEEIDRARLDPWLAASVPHLPIRCLEGTVVIGPLVVPGRTACLRCLDAHRTQDDPGYRLRLARRTAAARRDGVAEPIDLARAQLAVSWAVRDLVSHLDGGRPATRSATVHLPPDLAELTVVAWLRHPECGCGWTDGNHPSVTMGP